MPYHETLTVFWMRRVFDLMKAANGGSLVETANEILEICADKDLPLKFYSRQLLFSPEARQKFVAADLEDPDNV